MKYIFTNRIAPRRRRRLSSHRSNQPAARRATTLIELLVVMTVMSVLLGVVITLLTTLTHQHRSATRQRETQSSLDRLARQFRTDVRASVTIEQEESPIEDSSLESSSPDSFQVVCERLDGARVVYSFFSNDAGSSSEVRRVETNDNELKLQETYRLPPGAHCQLTNPSELPDEIRELVVSYPLGGARNLDIQGALRRAPIRAALGRDAISVTTSARTSEDSP